ncbi:MAG: MOSC domain-containing protein [Vulcanimicrobiaceae bacterium]
MREPHPLGTISHLWRYPVKALRGEALAEAALDENGLAGDRRAALFVTSPQHPRTGKTLRGKEHNLLHTVDDPQAAIALAAARAVAVVTEVDGPYFDARPVSLILDTWLAEAERLVGFELDPLRYRPNIFARADPLYTGDETSLIGVNLAIGPVLLRVLEPIRRCVTPSYDLVTGEAKQAVQRAVIEHRGNLMGVYCAVQRPGSIRIGDTIFIEP